MKAKEHAARLIGAASQTEYEHLLFADLDELVFSTISAMQKCAKAQAALGCIRETFTKWKSIVAQVRAANPALFINEGMFVKYFSAASAPLFVTAVEGRALLGYDLDAEDREVLRQGKSKIAAIEMRERLVQMQREAKALGISPNLMLANAVLRGEIVPSELIVAAVFGDA